MTSQPQEAAAREAHAVPQPSSGKTSHQLLQSSSHSLAVLDCPLLNHHLQRSRHFLLLMTYWVPEPHFGTLHRTAGNPMHPLISFELPWWLRWLRIRLQCRRPGFDPWVGKTPPGKGNGKPLQCSCLVNCTDRGAWRATVQWISKSWT